MWPEIFPGVAALLACMYIPGLSVIFFQRIANGGKEKRVVRTAYQWQLLERDRRLSGVNKYFHSKGLENID